LAKLGLKLEEYKARLGIESSEDDEEYEEDEDSQ
jgi:hypothetical protein